MKAKKNMKIDVDPWEQVRGWKQVEVGDEILVGNEHFGFMGLEEIDPTQIDDLDEIIGSTGYSDPEEKGKAPKSESEMLEYIAKLERENKALKKEAKAEKKKKKKDKVGKRKAESLNEVSKEVEEEKVPQVDVTAWKDYFLPEDVLGCISRIGFTAPTQIQAECLPSAIRDRRDIIGAAQTVSIVYNFLCLLFEFHLS